MNQPLTESGWWELVGKLEFLNAEVQRLQLEMEDDIDLAVGAAVDGVEWPGVAYVGGRPFRDTDIAPDEISGSDGIITDNSTGGAKTWIKVVVTPGSEAVTYEDSAVFVDGRFPEDTEYFLRENTLSDIHVTRFG